MHADRPKSIAVLLPAYNEAVTIAQTITSFHQALPEASIWVIDNASTDRTNQIAQHTLSQIGCAGGILFEPSKGKGNAVRRGFLEIKADIYVLSDADTTYPAEQARELIEPVLNNQADMVVGDRHSNGRYAQENTRALHGFGNNLVKWLVNKLFKANLADIMSGYRVFSDRFVRHYPIMAEGFEVETDLTLHALDKRFRVLEVPVEYRDRPAGSTSKLNTLSDGMRVLSTISTILRHYRPMFFFGWLAAITCLLGLVAAIPVFQDWFREGYIYHVPLAILATGLEIVALILFAVGLILDSLCHQKRQQFQITLLNYNQRHSNHVET